MYLAFPDGVLNHVCPECDALCCRAGDFGGSLRREMGKVLSLYPALQNAVSARYGDFISITTPVGGCFFLDSDNLCRIQKERGKALKPSVCVLFPFNTIHRLGKTVVISPHFKCPLRLQLPALPGKVAGTHSAIKRLVRELNFLDEGYLNGFAQLLPLRPSEDAEHVVSREARFRDLCAEEIGNTTFGETLRAASSDRRELERNIIRGARILGLAKPSRRRSHDSIDDLFLAIAPALRLNLLRLPANGILLALSLGEIAFRQAMTIASGQPTLQGSYYFTTNIGPALRLIGLVDEPMGFSKAASAEAPPHWSPEMKLAGYVILRQAQGSTGALEALERATPSSLSIADRSALLMQIGRAIEHARVSEESRISTAV